MSADTKKRADVGVLLQRLVMRLRHMPEDIGDYYDLARENTVETDPVLLDSYGPVCEFALKSTRTGRRIGYWAYGYHDPSYPAGTRFGEWVSGRLKSHNEVADRRVGEPTETTKGN